MSRLLPLAVLAAALVAAAPARADEPDEHNEAQTAKALTLQALAILDAGRSHEEAIEKLDEALEVEDRHGVDLRAIRAAHEALHDEEVEQAHETLHLAFPGTPHLAGVTFRPASGAAQAVAAAGGAIALLLGGFGLVRRRRLDARMHA